MMDKNNELIESFIKCFNSIDKIVFSDDANDVKKQMLDNKYNDCKLKYDEITKIDSLNYAEKAAKATLDRINIEKKFFELFLKKDLSPKELQSEMISAKLVIELTKKSENSEWRAAEIMKSSGNYNKESSSTAHTLSGVIFPIIGIILISFFIKNLKKK